MPTTHSDDDLDALLADGRLSGSVRDRIFEHVADRVGARDRVARPWLRWPLGLGGLAVAAAAIVLIATPRARVAQDPLRAKGAPAGAAELEVSCRGGTLEACPVGAILLFAADGAEGYLAAYAEPRPSGERVWYFSADGESPPVRAAAGLHAVQKAIRIGSEHPPGPYVLHLFLTRTPLSREALRAGPARDEVVAAREVSLTVTPPGAGAEPARAPE